MNKEKKNDFLYDILALLLGVAMIAAGLWGIVSSRIESKEYKNSSDIKSVSRVFRTEKNAIIRKENFSRQREQNNGFCSARLAITAPITWL